MQIMRLALQGKAIFLRPVTPADAEDLIRLRTNPRCRGCLAPTSSDVGAQQAWLQAYQERERLGQEIYSAVCRTEDQQIVGAFRILDLKDRDFGLGSWVVAPGAERTAALESILLMYDIMFLKNGYETTHFEVQRGNLSSLRFHPKLGAEVVGSNDHEFHFMNTAEAYRKVRPRYERFLPLPA